MPDNAAIDMLSKNATAPELSATSDLPKIVEKTESVENSPKDGTTTPNADPKGEKVEEAAASEEHGDPTANPQAKPAKGVQKRIDELTRKAGDAERRADEQSKRLEQALSLIERLAPQRETEKPSNDDRRPSRQEFDDPDIYTEALSQWSVRQALQARDTEEQARKIETDNKKVFDSQVKTWTDGREKAIEKYPDYAEVAENPDVEIAQHVGFAIVNNPAAHEIAYYLGKNPKEAERISALNPLQSAMEIGALGARLAQAKPEVSQAPAPVKPIGSKNDASPKSPNEESMDEYAARRNAELKESRKRR